MKRYLKEKDDILGFDVAMYDLMRMRVSDGLDHLPHDFGCELLSLLEMLHEGAAGGILHEEKYVVVVAEVAVEFDDVGVVQTVLDLQLVGELLQHVILEDGRF